ncbi:hypothetical protein HMPREF0004_0534 [Achromobacter piechaudii ATCC 43553]|uniref:Uncharacterized protein n=1 Tax=Achromobacter piechaudii ATCC 43553 TaxID=742159 RepID=D4X4Y7_9BURK|nr:hypothetical protein HMPREF0004_0534 [Achromobacter piechaudii ATCC 43553]
MSDYIAEISDALRVRDGDLNFVSQEFAMTRKDLESAQAEITMLQNTRCARWTRKLQSFFGKA